MAGKPTGENWHRRAVVGKEDWSDGEKHMAFLVARGLEPHHRVLDVGCGSLRTGVHLIRYLDKGLYYGIDNEASLLDAARENELSDPELAEKEPTLHLSGDFDVAALNADGPFDFVWAYSLFTHLKPKGIRLCLKRVMEHVSQDGVFYASFNRSDKIEDMGPHSWRDEVLVTRYPFRFFKNVAKEQGLEVEHVGPAIVDTYPEYPNKQRILAYRKKAA